MTETDDRIIVSKQALEMARELAKKCDDNTLDYLREIIDTGEVLPPKRLCWCGAEMREISVPGGGWRVTCSEGYTAHGTGPVAPTESEAWAAYDKMMRGGEG